MKVIRWTLAAPLYVLGLLFLAATFAFPFDETSDTASKIFGCLFCLALTGGFFKLANWLVKSRSNEEEKSDRATSKPDRKGKTKSKNQTEDDRLQPIFFRLVKENNGRVTQMQLAIAAEISGTEAKKYLDEQAKAFGANFNVSEEGFITYQFPPPPPS